MNDVWCDRSLIIAPIFYCVCASEETFKRELADLEIQEKDWPPFILNEWSNATVHFLSTPSGSQCALVCVRFGKERTGIEIAGLLTHEAVHIWQSIRENIGEDRPSSEFEAYSIQCIAQRLMESYSRQIFEEISA